MELQVIEENAIVTAFAKRGGTDELFDRIAQEARSFVPDVSTKKGRDAIGSLALKISKSKTLIEKYGKELVAEQKAQIKLIDDDRISVVKKFDELRNEILAPRDAWEQAEKDRVYKHEQAIVSIAFYKTSVIADKDSQWLKGVIQNVESIVIDGSFEEFEEQAKITKYETIEYLRTALAAREKYEAEQAELERLRQAEQERQQREHEERIAREAAEKATREAEEKARFEAERVQREKIEAEQREARLKAEKEAAELRAEQAAENERKRIEVEQAAKAEAEQKAEEARLANVEYMRSVNQAAAKAMTDLCVGLEDYQIKAIITAIAKQQIPNISIKY